MLDQPQVASDSLLCWFTVDCVVSGINFLSHFMYRLTNITRNLNRWCTIIHTDQSLCFFGTIFSSKSNWGPELQNVLRTTQLFSTHAVACGFVIFKYTCNITFLCALCIWMSAFWQLDWEPLQCPQVRSLALMSELIRQLQHFHTWLPTMHNPMGDEMLNWSSIMQCDEACSQASVKRLIFQTPYGPVIKNQCGSDWISGAADPCFPSWKLSVIPHASLKTERERERRQVLYCFLATRQKDRKNRKTDSQWTIIEFFGGNMVYN